MIWVGSVNCSLAIAMEQRGIELAVGEVAGAAEHDEIERIDLGEFRRHFNLMNLRGAGVFERTGAGPRFIPIRWARP